MSREAINNSAYWREFERNNITHSAAHYLMAIDSLRNEYGYARVTDVADMLEVSRGAASMSLSQLKKRGWVSEDPNRFLLLTEEGEQMARIVEHNFRILSTFFERVLGVPKHVALADACKMEHLMSLDTGHRLVSLMRYILDDEKRIRSIKRKIGATACECDDVESCPLCEDECMMMAKPAES